MKYFTRRIANSVLLLAGVSVLCFIFSALAPGSFFDEMKLNPQISQDTLAHLKTQYGLDQPILVRYTRWVGSVLKGEWGYSFAYNLPVRSVLVTRACNTLLLTVLSTMLAWMLAVPLGVWIARHSGHWVDKVCMASTALFLSLPELVVVLGLLYFAVQTHFLPVGGMVSWKFHELSLSGKLLDLLAHLAIPSITLVVAALPTLVRHVRTSMIETLDLPFIRSAKGHGIGPVRLMFQYALPVAANPLISLFGLSIGGLLSGSLLVEVVTGWPGLGPLLLEATVSRDLYVVIGVVMACTLFMIFGNFLADVFLFSVDPRIRMES